LIDANFSVLGAYTQRSTYKFCFDWKYSIKYYLMMCVSYRCDILYLIDIS